MAFVGKQRFEKDMIASPPTTNTTIQDTICQISTAQKNSITLQKEICNMNHAYPPIDKTYEWHLLASNEK